MRLSSKRDISSILCRCLPFVWLVLAGAALAFFEPVYLRRVEELSLFQSTPMYFRECMLVPGGMLSWSGAYLTQLFYYPVLGVSVLCLLWVALMLLSAWTFRIPRRWMALTLIPVAMLLISDVYLGYWIFYMKLRGYFFVATLGALVAVCMALLSRVLPRYARTVIIAVAVACLYPVAGFYALLGGVLMAVMSWRSTSSRWLAVLDTVVAAVAIVGVPLICYRTLYHETNIANIYWTALPVFHLRKENFPLYNLPYVVLVLSLVGMAAFGGLRGGRKAEQADGHKFRWAPCALMALLAVAVVWGWYKDGNFHRELRMSRCLNDCDWDGALNVARYTDEAPTRSMWMMKNVALTRLGKIGEEMYDFRNGASRPNAPFETRIVQSEGKMLYLNYGLPNYCYRWCIEDGVVFGWNVEQLKLLTKCMLLNGEFTAAQKFIRMLKKTMFHKKWAVEHDEYVHNPSLMMQDKELLPIVRLLSREDYLDSDNAQIERFLIMHLAGTVSESPELQEQALVAAMQTRNIGLFWHHFLQYVNSHQDKPVPTLFQQAACLFGGMDKQVDVSKMPFDKSVVDGCAAFQEELRGHRERGLSMEQIKPLMYDRYYRTYYYDYYFNTYQEEAY